MSNTLSVRDQMLYARSLVQQGHYAQARSILNKIDHPKAKEWLAQLDERELNAPLPVYHQPQQIVYQSAPQSEKKRRKGQSCMTGCLSLILLVALAVVAVVLFANTDTINSTVAGQNARIDGTLRPGTIDNPIAVGEWISFEGALIQIERMVRPATAAVEGFTPANEDPAAGAEYVLLWVNVACQQDKCEPQFDLKIRLVDSRGKEWGEPFIVILDPNLDGQEAVRGGSVAGWQAFEYPANEPISAVWVKWNGQTRYALPPGTASAQAAG